VKHKPKNSCILIKNKYATTTRMTMSCSIQHRS